MSAVLKVSVLGVPAPQGSKKSVGNNVMVESSKALAPWRDSVAYAVRDQVLACGWQALDEAATVLIDFYLPAPQTRPKKRVMPDRMPDLDKLIRGVLDAVVTGGALCNDARVVALDAVKHYAEGGHAAGADIVVRAWAPF